ncbi:MAG: hypothetical protein ACXWMH_05625 [Syntrophales bacterium]
MGFAQTMERKVFFNIIRWFAFIITVIGFAAMIVGAFLFITNFRNIFPMSSVNVNYQEVQSIVESKEAAIYNEKVKSDIKNAYTSAQAFFSRNPIGIVSTDILTNYGYRATEGVNIKIDNGASMTLSLSAKHSRGDTTYHIDASGNIKEEKEPSATVNQQVHANSDLQDSAKNKKQIESLVNEIINQFPKDRINVDTSTKYFRTVAESLKEEYQLPYLNGLLLTLKSIPQDKKNDLERLTSFAGEYTDLFKKKVDQTELRKQVIGLQGMKDFAIYAGTIFTGLMVIALFGLILILLAIERNTRKDPP